MNKDFMVRNWRIKPDQSDVCIEFVAVKVSIG